MTDKPMSAERLEEIRRLEQRLGDPSQIDAAGDALTDCLAEIDRLRAPPDEAEVAAYVQKLRHGAGFLGRCGASKAADLLTRLSERAEKAEARVADLEYARLLAISLSV